MELKDIIKTRRDELGLTLQEIADYIWKNIQKEEINAPVFGFTTKHWMEYEEYIADEYVSLAQYADAHNITADTMRQRISRGLSTTAKKIGRNWVIAKNEPYIDNRIKTMEESKMKNLNSEKITDKIIEEINANCKFVDDVDLKNYDNISVYQDGNIIELEKNDILEEEIIKDGNVEEILYTDNTTITSFRKDSISGIYVEY